MALRERRWTMKTSAAANTTTKTKDQKKNNALKRSIKHDLRPGKGKATPVYERTAMKLKRKNIHRRKRSHAQ